MASEKHMHEHKEALKSFGVSDLNKNLLDYISLSTLLEWSVDESDPRLSFRSSWAVEHILLKNADLLQTTYQQVIANFIILNHWSSLRSYSKLIMSILSVRNILFQITKNEREDILEKSFQIISQPDCPVAVKVNVLDIIFDLCCYFDGLVHELKLIIELNLEKENSSALMSRGTKILKKIEVLK